MVFAEKIEKIFKTLSKVKLDSGLYFNYLNQNTAQWCMKHASIGALGDSFYEYLLKYWLYNNKRDADLFNMYIKSMDAIRTQLVGVSSRDKLTYFGDLRSQKFEKKMGHLACFSGGLMALTSLHLTDARSSQEYMSLGKNVTNTCHESYIRAGSQIGPEYFHFEREDEEATSLKHDEKGYLLRPEVVESYFYLWRLTKEQKYRDWAWQVVLALEKQCRTDSGFSGLKDVYLVDSPKDDVQQSFFLAETLKYLWLIFSDDDVLPLDKYVFNTEAHPFLIKTI
jgi:mannosyl-oligosaccharide alpha-1,2-mannosidase